MRVLRTRDELRAALADAPRPLGLVPTMGWLHAGHRSLMQRARAESATTIATIFVNPRQFNEAADYQQYPRDEARDLAICEEERLDLVFAPGVEEIYPPGFDTTVTRRRRRAAARGGGAAGPLRRRRDRRRDPVRPRRRRSGVLRPEGRPAGHGHPPDGARPRDPDRGRSPVRRSASRTAWRSRHGTSTSRPPSAPPRRSCAGRSSPDASAGRPASGRRARSATRCRRRSPRSRWPARVRLGRRRADARGAGDGGRAGAPVARRPLRRDRLIDNEPIGEPDSRLRRQSNASTVRPHK